MKKIWTLILTCLTACGEQQHGRILEHSTQRNEEKSKKLTIKPTLEEYFVDSLSVGQPSFNKIKVAKYKTPDSMYVRISFYTKGGRNWELKNNFHFLKDGIMGCTPQLQDFNNDGYNDLTYISSVAARGINEIRTLFIYNPQKDQLILIKNSAHYTNLRYEKHLNCISSFFAYGSGCGSIFLKLKSDTLQKFASVILSAEDLVVKTYNDQGEEQIIYKDPTNIETMVRYKNFNPLVSDEGR